MDIDGILAKYVTILSPSERHNAVVVLGSFKQYDRIKQIISQFQEHGLHVIAPSLSKIIEGENGFSILESDLVVLNQLRIEYPNLSEWDYDEMIEDIFCAHMQQARYIYIVDEDGYIGQQVALEIGTVLRNPEIQLYAMEPLNPRLDWDDGVDYFTGAIWAGTAEQIKTRSPEDFIAQINQKNEMINNL
jgi:hypothetical protein